jgi:competence protein ComEA
MTAPSVAAHVTNRSMLTTRLTSGDIVELLPLQRKRNEIKISSMTAEEKMLLHIPLHPDSMNAADWDCLPGIGPELARRIVIYRQNNGDFGSLQAVERVPGMGKGKIEKIIKYFNAYNLPETQQKYLME